MAFLIAIEADWDEIFHEKSRVGETFEIFFWGGGDLAFGCAS